MDKSKLTPGELGHGFEDYVKRVFERNGYALMEKNQWRKNYAFEKDYAHKREYDLVMYHKEEKQFCIIECKAHYSQKKYVDRKLVQEFDHKLRHYNGAHAIRLMVSDTDFTETARKYAATRNIQLVNGRDLKKMAGSKPSFIGSVENAAYRSLFSSLENIVSKALDAYRRR